MKRAYRLLAFVLSMMLLVASMAMPVAADDKEECRKLRIEFTSDIHSHMSGMARLSTLLKTKAAEFTEGDTIYLDGGDFSQGTLYQTGYISEASELSLLSMLGCTAATIGNHEWDLAGTGFADMLNTAMEKNETLSPLLCANLDFRGLLTNEQKYVKETLDKYVEKSGQDSIENTIIETENGLKIGLFGIAGIESIEDSPTSGMRWIDGIEAATKQVNYLKDKCDMIICISHSGLDDVEDGEEQTGEDIDLANACPDIDMIISGHSHTFKFEPVMVGNTIIVASGEYLQYMGCVDATIDKDGNITYNNYALNAVDDSVDHDRAVQTVLDGYRNKVDNEYLRPYGIGMNDVISHSSFDFTSLADMYATHDEYPMGNLIADSYMYEAKKNGIDDIDVVLVGLGTIRGSFQQGDITTEDAFEICSLGAGKDNSAGHPILTAYITGEELKLLVELDASLGPLVSSIKMSYAGLEYEFNTERALLDRVTSVHLVREDGTTKRIYDDELYKVCCNMYAANMLGMLNGLTKGILKIVPKYEDGTPVKDFYTCELVDKTGREIKEWYAFADYISSFEKNSSGISEIPDAYKEKQGRKYKYSKHGISAIRNPGPTTIAFMTLGWVVIGIIIIIWLKVRNARK